MKTPVYALALVLGLLSAVGPFAIDMYMPALPAIQAGFVTTVDQVQLSLTIFFVALALGQLVYGPAADMFGRRPPLVVGLLLFIVASIGCATAGSIESLIAWRFLQGIGACAGMIVPRAVVRDLYTGTEAARLMALLILVLSVSPILSPLLGSSVTAFWSWRVIFAVVALLALLALLLTIFVLEETRGPELRADSNWRSALRGYGVLVRDPVYMGWVLVGGFAMSGFFVYLSNSSFVLMEHFGLTSMQYSLVFGLNAISFIGAAQLTGRLSERYGMARLVAFAAVGFTAALAALLTLTLMGVDRLGVLMALLFVGYGFMGLAAPTTAVLALDRHGAIAGTASALLGTLQFVTGAVAMAITGLFLDGTPRPMVAGIFACALLTLLTTRWVLRQQALEDGVVRIDSGSADAGCC